MTVITNLSSLRAAVRDRMARSDLGDALIDGHVRLVEAHIRRKMDLIGLETEITTTLSAERHALPADLEELLYIRTTGDQGCYLTPKTEANALKFRDEPAGRPRHYVQTGNLTSPVNIDLLPRPSGSFEARLGYRARAELQDDDDTNTVVRDHPDVYLNGCLHYAHLHLENESKANLYGSYFETALGEATTDDLMGRWGDGPLLPSASYVEGSVRR